MLQPTAMLHYTIIVLVQVRLRREVPYTPSLTQLGFELMTSRSWQYISCYWDACSNHSAISDFHKEPIIFFVQVWLRTEVLCTPSLTRPVFELMTDYDSTFHVSETPALTTRPSVTSLYPDMLQIYQQIDIYMETSWTAPLIPWNWETSLLQWYKLCNFPPALKKITHYLWWDAPQKQ